MEAEEIPLSGGVNGGAVRVGDTVRKAADATTPAVTALLRHLEAVGFSGAPRALGLDERGRAVLSHLDGDTVGVRRPRPDWARSDATLGQVGRWLRGYHAAVADFVPPPDARWFGGGALGPGDVVCHHDAGPYNAVHGPDGLVGFIDWDLACPGPPVRDLAFVAISWVPLLPDAVADGFPAGLDRTARLRLLLDAYGWPGTWQEVLDAVVRRADDHAEGLERAAADGYGPAVALVEDGVAAAHRGVRGVVAALA